MPSFDARSIPADDFRVSYLYEAQACLKESNRILKRYPKDWNDIPEFWANLMGAIANANVAAVSDNVALGFFVKEQQRKEEHKLIRDMLDEKLGSCPTTGA